MASNVDIPKTQSTDFHRRNPYAENLQQALFATTTVVNVLQQFDEWKVANPKAVIVDIQMFSKGNPILVCFFTFEK